MSDANDNYNATRMRECLREIADADRASRSVENKKQRDFLFGEYQKNRAMELEERKKDRDAREQDAHWDRISREKQNLKR